MTEYTGVLATRIDPSAIGLRWPDGRRGLLATEQEHAEEDRRILNAQFEKMPALFACHGVALGDWSELCLRLAETHVPGFMLKKTKQSKDWTAYDEAEFVCDVNEERTAANISIPEAIKLVIRRDRWKKPTAPETIVALQTRYKRARKAHALLVSTLEKSRLFDRLQAERADAVALATGKKRVQKTKA